MGRCLHRSGAYFSCTLARRKRQPISALGVTVTVAVSLTGPGERVAGPADGRVSIVLGLVTSKRPELESPDLLLRRLDERFLLGPALRHPRLVLAAAAAKFECSADELDLQGGRIVRKADGQSLSDLARFLRGLHFIEYGQQAFTEIVETVVTLANSEDLPAHGEAMTARLENLS